MLTIDQQVILMHLVKNVISWEWDNFATTEDFNKALVDMDKLEEVYYIIEKK